MAINNQPTIEPRTITGIFTKYIAKTLPLAFDESMSYYECLCALLEYLNETIVPDINNTNEGLSELQTFYLQLQNYVNNYFENLDVQEEINQKLDELVENGTITNIIQSYITPYIAEQNEKINEIDVKVNNATSGSPLVASSIEEMTDTNRVYVNTSDNYWYYFNGTEWTRGGIYQASSNENIVDSLNHLLTNINVNINEWEVGGFTGVGNYGENPSAIRWLNEVPSFVKKAYLGTTNYKLYVVKKLKVSPNTTTREEVETPFIFDHENYSYNVYLLQNPTSSSASVNDFNLLYLYADINSLYNILLNKSNIEESPKYKYIKTYQNEFDSGIIDNVGNEYLNTKGIRTINYLDSSVSKVKILDTDGDCNLVVCRYRKDGTFVDRLSFYKEYNDFNHDVYNYRIYMISESRIKTTMYWNILFYRENNFNKNFTLNYFYDNDTSTYYSLLRINKTKEDGSLQFPFVYAPNGALGVVKSTLNMMLDNNFIIGTNGGIASRSAGTNIPFGIIIENGIVIKDTIDTDHHALPLTINSNGDLYYAPYDEDANNLVNNGIISAICGWYPLIDNFEKITSIDYSSIGVATEKSQRQIIGQFANGDYAFITCEGRNYNNSIGWDISQAQEICKKHNLKFAYNLDGGGSVETVIENKQINLIYEGTTGRPVQNYIVFNGTNNFN